MRDLQVSSADNKGVMQIFVVPKSVLMVERLCSVLPRKTDFLRRLFSAGFENVANAKTHSTLEAEPHVRIFDIACKSSTFHF